MATAILCHTETLDACLRCESLSTLPIHLLSSPPPAWLFGPHHSPQSKPVLDKAAEKTWEKQTRKKLGWSDLCVGGAKYIIAPSIAHCDWVVYAVNTGDKPMGHWLLAVPEWWQKINKNNNNSVGPLSASAHRENARYARLPIQPCWHALAAFCLQKASLQKTWDSCGRWSVQHSARKPSAAYAESGRRFLECKQSLIFTENGPKRCLLEGLRLYLDSEIQTVLYVWFSLLLAPPVQCL